VKSAFEQTASSYADEVYKLGPTAVPPMLYHYTDAAGLLGMLNSGSIWLTDHRFLNDKSELEHTHGTLRELLASKEDQSPSTQAKKLYDAIRLYARTESSQDIHIFSLTEDPDDLSQWRGYAREGLGFTIGFCGLTLREIADPDDAVEQDVSAGTTLKRIIGDVNDGVAQGFSAVRSQLPAPPAVTQDDVAAGQRTTGRELAATRDQIHRTLGAVKSVLGNGRTIVRSAVNDNGSSAATATTGRKTPVRDAVKKTGGDIKKVVTKVSNSAKKALRDRKHGHDGTGVEGQ